MLATGQPFKPRVSLADERQSRLSFASPNLVEAYIMLEITKFLMVLREQVIYIVLGVGVFNSVIKLLHHYCLIE